MPRTPAQPPCDKAGESHTRIACSCSAVRALSSQCVRPLSARCTLARHAQDAAFDRVIQALYGDVDTFDAEVILPHVLAAWLASTAGQQPGYGAWRTLCCRQQNAFALRAP